MSGDNTIGILQALNNDDSVTFVKEGIVDKIMERGTAVQLIGGDPTIRILFDEVDPFEDGDTAIWGIVELEHEMNEEGPASIDDDDAEGLCDWVRSVFDDASDNFAEEISSTLEEVSFVILYKGDYYG